MNAARHLEGVDDVVRQPDRLSAELKLVGAGLFGGHFAEREITAIEVADVTCADTLKFPETERLSSGRIRRRDLDTRIGETERRAGQRTAALTR